MALQSSSSSSIPALLPVARAQQPVRRALFSALLSCAMLGAGALPVLQLLGVLHLPVDAAARAGVVFLGPALLSVSVPLLVAARQHLRRRRAWPWLLVAALGPMVVLVLGSPLWFFLACIGCRTLA